MALDVRKALALTAATGLIAGFAACGGGTPPAKSSDLRPNCKCNKKSDDLESKIKITSVESNWELLDLAHISDC